MNEINVTFNDEKDVVKSGESWVYTDSLNLAEVLEYDHKRIMDRVRKILSDYNIEDSHLNCPSSGITDTTEFVSNNTDFNYSVAYYKNSQNKLQPYYRMSKDLLVLVVFSYRKLPKAQEIQKAYIAKFNAMEKELHWWRARYLGIDIRNNLTDSIKEYLESPKWYHYKNLTDIVYQSAFGKKPTQIRKEFNLDKKANVREFLTEESLKLVKSIEDEMSVLLSYGFDYKKIKDLMESKHTTVHNLKLKQDN